MSDRLLDDAKNAVDNLFGDTSVSKRETVERLEEVASDIEDKITVLNEEIRNEEGD